MDIINLYNGYLGNFKQSMQILEDNRKSNKAFDEYLDVRFLLFVSCAARIELDVYKH